MPKIATEEQNFQGFIVNNSGAISIGLEAIKSLFLVHTGAVGALLAFTGQAFGKTSIDNAPKIISIASSCLPYFGIGIVISLLTFFFAYFYQMCITETWRTEHNEWCKYNCHSKWLFGITLTLFFAGILLFCVGCIVAYTKIYN